MVKTGTIYLNHNEGQTETGGGSHMTVAKDPLSWHVGAPFTSLEAKLVDVPEMQYFTDNYTDGEYNPKGEVRINSEIIL